jgi:hypothetical protein
LYSSLKHQWRWKEEEDEKAEAKLAQEKGVAIVGAERNMQGTGCPKGRAGGERLGPDSEFFLLLKLAN